MTERFLTPPDGGSTRTESLEFRTAIAIARDGTESRVATRAHPRLSLTETYYLKPADLSALQQLRRLLPVLKPMHHIAGRPEILMQLSSSSSVLETITHTFHRISITLESLSPFESFSPISEPVYPVPAPKFLKHNFSTALKDLCASDVDSFDSGFVRQKTVRYQKRSLQVQLALLSAEQITEFRLFVCALRGACGSFFWTAPGALEQNVWRLGSDLISINHVTANYATVQLSLVELE